MSIDAANPLIADLFEQRPLHHRDPFDHLLVAQAIGGPFTLLSADAAFNAYGCPLQDGRT